MQKKIDIGKNSRVCIKWDVKPIDYSHETEDNIKVKFAEKYGIDKNSIKIEPRFIKTVDGVDQEFTNDVIENIQDPIFQQKLFKQYLEDKNYEDFDFQKIIEIDNLMNNSIDYTLYEKSKKYSINWIKWSNFMSYGEDNYFSFKDINGLVLLSSEPANQGGKTTFSIDLLRFLLFGKVTSRESDWTLSKAFNKHIPEATEVVVEGSITIDGNEYVIKRTLSRPALNKRTDKSKVTQKINYYKIVNNEYIELEDEENEQKSSSTETNKTIKEAIGNERDFDIMICVDSDNLKSLISLKDTERGRLISRWIGLLPLEEKEKVAKDMYNHQIVPKLLLNKYNKEEVKNNIKSYKESNEELSKEVKKTEENIKDLTKEIEDLTKNKETLLQSKKQIDNNLLKIDVETLTKQIESIVITGKKLRKEKETNEKLLEEISNVEFDKAKYLENDNKISELNRKLGELRILCKNCKESIETLKKGEFCPTCGARLKNVDNTEAIKQKQDNLDKLIVEGKSSKEELEKCNKYKLDLEETRKQYEQKNKLLIIIDKNKVDIENVASRYRELNRTLKDIEENKDAIDSNARIDASINTVNATINTKNNTLRAYNSDLLNYNSSINYNNKSISDSEKIISSIEEEEKLVYNWKLYLEMIGKNGISKLVIRNTLPLINGELANILSDVCDFTVLVEIDDHNDVAFYMVHDGIKSNLASGSGFEQTVSAIALRSVLSKISSFSKPSFVVFDEVLGGVSDENYEYMKKLYEKVVKDYGTILQITHLKQIYDWHSKQIVISKKNNISYIK